MITDTEIKVKGIQILAQYLGDVDAERFIALIQREPFDYTKWRQEIDEELSIKEISRRAMALRNKNTEQSNYSAYVPDLPGCVATGTTIEEVENEIREAIEFHIEGIRQDVETVPQPSSSVQYIEVVA